MAGQEQMKFSTDLWDGFPLVVRKTECGLQSCKDILAFYRKRAQIEEEYSKALVKLCISATSEKRMIFKGRGNGSVIAESPTILHAWETVIVSTERAAKVHGETAKKFNDDCAEPVASFIKDMEKQREKHVQEGTRFVKEYEDALAALEKSRQNYFKANVDNEIAEKEVAESKLDSKAKDTVKLAAKSAAANDKVKQVEAEYREKLQIANTVQEKHLKESLPKVLDELEHWEGVRSRLIKSNIKKFYYAIERVPEVLKDSADQVGKGLGVIDHHGDIERFVEENKTYNVPPGTIEFEAYISGHVALDKKKFNLSEIGSNLGSLARKATSISASALSSAASLASGGSATSFSYITKEERKEGVFEIPLEDVMALQKDQPDEIPKVFSALTSAVKSMGGFESEGIFRVPASSSEVQNLKKSVNQGNYEITDLCTDVNVPAALLKLWLRSLPEPLIPTPLYDHALSSSSPEGAVAVFNKLPPYNSKIVKHLVLFLTEMTHPDFVAKTKMNLENLAMVFAPSLLRCPSEDPLTILANAKKEQAFMRNLILGLAPPEANITSGLAQASQAPPKPERLSSRVDSALIEDDDAPPSS